MHKKRFLGIALVVVGLVILATGFAMLWAVVPSADSTHAADIRASNIQGGVTLARAGTEAWEPLTADMALHAGDRIKTADDGSLQINWGGRGMTRVDEGSELVLDAVPEGDAVTGAVLSLKVASGRAWSRMLKLLDLDSRVEVRTDGIVATVRGTAFGVAKDGTASQIAVTESVVQVVPNSEQAGGQFFPDTYKIDFGNGEDTFTDPNAVIATDRLEAPYKQVLARTADVSPQAAALRHLIPEGKWGSFSATGTPSLVCNLKDIYPWPTENGELDTQFDLALREELARQFTGRLLSASPSLIGLSERLHLALGSRSHRRELIASVVGRRIAEALQYPYRASAILGSIDPAWLENLDTESHERILGDVRSALFVEAARPGFAPPADLVHILQDMRRKLLGSTPSGERYAEALDIDDAIDAFRWPPEPRTPEDQETLRQQLVAAIVDWRHALRTDEDLTPEQRQALEAKADSLLVRIIDMGEMPGCTSVVTGADDTQMSQMLLIKPRKKKVVLPAPLTPTSASPVLPATACPSYDSLALKAMPSSGLSVGDAATLNLSALCSDGLTQDLTAGAVFVPAVASEGSITGNVFTAATSGVLTIFASIDDHGTTKTAQTNVTVNPPATPARLSLVKIDVGTIGPTALATGQTAPLTAQAVYSDGTVTDIVYQCGWSTSDAKLGTISSQRFYALSGQGTVDAICTFTDQKLGVTKTGSLTFTVVLDPSLMPTNTGGGTRGGRTSGG